MAAANTRRERTNRVSSAMGQKMLLGWVLLDDHCTTCEVQRLMCHAVFQRMARAAVPADS